MKFNRIDKHIPASLLSTVEYEYNGWHIRNHRGSFWSAVKGEQELIATSRSNLEKKLEKEEG